MPIELYVSKDRNIYITNQPDISSSNIIGVTGENNATVLRFSFFEELNGKSVSDFKKELVAVNSQGSFKYEFADELTIQSELTTDTELSLQIKIYDADEIVFKSNPHLFYFADSIDDSGDHFEITLTPENWYERIEESWIA